VVVVDRPDPPAIRAAIAKPPVRHVAAPAEVPQVVKVVSQPVRRRPARNRRRGAKAATAAKPALRAPPAPARAPVAPSSPEPPGEFGFERH